ncbi:MAG: hypothetical protein HY074_05755 [Deltaproteobacteria bacterium]|nr:hypothetical protein [Deltaproteobacteria bacterium]
MEKEVSKSGRKVKAQPQLPVNGNVMAQCGIFFNHEVVSAIGVIGFQRIAAKHSPDVIAPLLAALKQDDVEAAVNVLRSLTAVPPTEFLNAAGWIWQMTHEAAANWFGQHGLISGPNETRGAFAVRAYFDHPDAFSSAVLKCIEENAFGQRPFNVFQPCRPIHNLATRPFDADAETQATALCQEHFGSRGYGPHCIVMRHSYARRLGFSIEHGTQRSGRAGFDLLEKAVTRQDRDRRMDSIFFDTKSKTLWISARSPRDVKFYVDLMGTILFGDAGIFSLRVKFDMSFAIAADLGARLAKLQRGRAKSVRLIYRGIQMTGRKKKIIENAEDRHDCISRHDESFDGFHDSGTVFGTTLRVDLAGEGNLHQDITVKSGSVLTGPGLSDADLQNLLLSLGIVKAYTND